MDLELIITIQKINNHKQKPTKKGNLLKQLRPIFIGSFLWLRAKTAEYGKSGKEVGAEAFRAQL